MAIAVQHAPTLTKAERANQRNAVLAGFLGWTLDAFDFFILTLVIDDIAKSFGRTRPDIALALTVALAARPIGAVMFGIGMGGEWGVGASLALESASPRLRGLLSGLLQEGYALGNLLSALAFR